MSQFQPETTFKFIIVGDSNVGKTNILSRYTKNFYNPSLHNTIGIEFSSRTVKIQDKHVKLQIWDTAGKEKYKCMAPMFYRGAQGAVVVFSLGDRESFEGLPRWVTELRENAAPEVDLVIVGNKSDLEGEEKVVGQEEALEYAKKEGVDYLEVSACQNRNIDVIFESLLVPVYKRYKKRDELIDKSMVKSVKIRGKAERKKKKQECC